MKLALALAVCLCLAYATDTTVDLSKDIKDVSGKGGDDSDATKDGSNGAGNVNQKAINEQKPADSSDDGDMQTITAKVGDTVSL
jgi:hypothetical protein